MQESTDDELTDDEEGFDDDGVVEEGEEEANLEHQSRRRGKDQDWKFLETFESIADYKGTKPLIFTHRN